MKLSFHGAVREVTGSCFLLQTAKTNLLIDCGMFQGERMCGKKNFDDFAFDVKKIEAVVVTHPHLDHTGRIPKLINEGFKGKIYMTEPTKALSRLVLEDAGRIMMENAKKCGDHLLYKKEDLVQMFAQCKAVNYHTSFSIGDASVMFHQAGHVLGSAYVSVQSGGKRIIFSGDIGNDNVPILPNTEEISTADIVVCESTYGNKLHELSAERTQKLTKAVTKTMKAAGVLMIPSFSIERTQELLYELDKLLPKLNLNLPIFLDSPLAIRATELYRQYKNYLHFDASILSESDRDFFSFPGLRETLSVQESKVINNVPAPKIIIAGSGMMTGGRIFHHLIRYLPDKKSTLLIIGYQAEGTLGRKLFDGAKKVKVYNKEVKVNASVKAIGAFSAHADMNKLTKWLIPADKKIPASIYLVHGDSDVKEEFKKHLKNKLKTKVIIPEYNQIFDL